MAVAVSAINLTGLAAPAHRVELVDVDRRTRSAGSAASAPPVRGAGLVGLGELFEPTGERVRGRESAVREVYLACYPQLAGWSAKLVGDRDLGHDIATEAFVRLLARWTTVAEPRPWLYMTASNLVRDHWRKMERERRALGRLGPLVEESGPAGDPTVRDLVERLPDRLRTVVLLHYYVDLPVRDIADVLGKAEGTVKRLLHDARQQLLAALEDAR